MNQNQNLSPPKLLPRILAKTEELKFGMASDSLTGSLLRTLVASKPGGIFLEIGTGTGLATAWMLDGMDKDSRLTSLEKDGELFSLALETFDEEKRAVFLQEDGERFLSQESQIRYDLIFADAWPGKYSHLDEALKLLKRGGLYVIDDMLPQSNWPDGHSARVEELIVELEMRADLIITKLNWSTGIIIATKIL
jgi:predicted O-methyltransferase YrrM